ncbi:MAG TPA: hypothetical protein DEG17_25850 [Cyanobacteria bacterium UBA11149]|nr:hypothetical protein [Cyanobacteria bacterium UBA11367]HBE59339.1 hypothetical protein [Cyanobacteria bacterium UBA11366]HBR76561.1 hypothetical protein [Cyanobacteria bacterium UBA11159]HBS72006.1 hypothetical protein [Cyanobacteria bacterium UBA11153]HBW92196.1 hypothetical protein [Cyanobacteria bacterium UBA11149]HCA97300.1 hypothetical protein [Cyanobacteria bacterium UBA9226]
MTDNTSDPLIPVFIPALILLLVHQQKKIGRPLTKHEVLYIRDNGVSIMMKTSHATAIDKKRGYSDLDPNLCWEQWCEYISNNPI